jgi:acyl-CoA synthetase (NDP forming)
MTLKVDSENVLHKTDRNGIVLNIQNKEELEKNYDIMSQSFPKSNMIIQPMQKIKTEMILGIKKDPIAGSVILCGMGGIYAEALKMVEIFIPPVNIQEIKEKIMGSSFSFLFKEYRGQNPYNLDEFSDIIFKLSLLAEEIEEIKELDINPLLIYNDRTPAMAIDVKIII